MKAVLRITATGRVLPGALAGSGDATEYDSKRSEVRANSEFSACYGTQIPACVWLGRRHASQNQIGSHHVLQGRKS